jgi:hypothetical protein
MTRARPAGLPLAKSASTALTPRWQHNRRVALHVAQLLMQADMPADDLVAVQPDPDQGHLRASIRVDRGQVRWVPRGESRTHPSVGEGSGDQDCSLMMRDLSGARAAVQYRPGRHRSRPDQQGYR